MEENEIIAGSVTKAEGKEDSDQACREDTYQKRTHIRFLKEWPFDLVSGNLHERASSMQKWFCHSLF